MNEANFACRTLNFTGATSYTTKQRASDSSTKGFTIDNLECPSNATDITDCSYESDVNCGAFHNVRIVCGKLFFMFVQLFVLRPEVRLLFVFATASSDNDFEIVLRCCFDISLL